MGKKSKKGVVRTNTKQHHAAGHGKATSTNTKASRGSSQVSSCDNSLDSNSVVLNNTMTKQATGNTGGSSHNSSTVAVTPMTTVHVKEQTLVPPAAQRSTMTEEELRAMIIHNIARQRSLNQNHNNTTTTTTTTKNNNKENDQGEGIPSMTVISSKQPTVFTLDLDTDNTDDNALTPVPVEKLSTIATEKVTTDTVVAPLVETVVVPEPIVNVNPVVLPKETVNPPVVPAKDESEEISTEPTVNDAIPVKEEPVVEPIPAPMDAKQMGDSQQQQQIWSSTLRSIVSADEDESEVLADTSLSNKAVMDVTPVKLSHSNKLIVPIIQTVSPSPDPSSKQSSKPISYLNKEEPIPSLDTPDKKDLEQNVKQDLCGCTIM